MLSAALFRDSNSAWVQINKHEPSSTIITTTHSLDTSIHYTVLQQNWANIRFNVLRSTWVSTALRLLLSAVSSRHLRSANQHQLIVPHCRRITLVTGTFVPAYFRSRERKFYRWNFRSLELSLPGTFGPKSENDVELSLPGTFTPVVQNLYFSEA